MWEVQGSGTGQGATITVNGETKAVENGANFKDTVLAAARTYGLGKFRLFLNDEEITPNVAPATVQAGHVIRLVAFDVAGAPWSV